MDTLITSHSQQQALHSSKIPTPPTPGSVPPCCFGYAKWLCGDRTSDSRWFLSSRADAQTGRNPYDQCGADICQLGANFGQCLIPRRSTINFLFVSRSSDDGSESVSAPSLTRARQVMKTQFARLNRRGSVGPFPSERIVQTSMPLLHCRGNHRGCVILMGS